MRELVELEHVGDGAGEERAVVADEHDAGAEPGDPPLEPVEPGEVEVVRRLVEQEDVEAREQQRGQPRPGRLAARQRDGRLVEQPGREPEVRPHLADPCVEVGAAEGQPLVERDGVAVVGSGVRRRQRGRGGVQLDGRREHARAARQVLADGLVGA